LALIPSGVARRDCERPFRVNQCQQQRGVGMQWSGVSFCLFAMLLGGCAQAPKAQSSSAMPAAVATPADSTPTFEIERSTDQTKLSKNLPIRIDNPYGDVRLRFGGYESLLEWRGVTQNMGSAEKIALSGSGTDAFVISARLPNGVKLASGQRIDITAYVPKGHDVEILTEQGLIEARGVQANLKVRSTSGDIALRGITGGIDIETGAGNIEGQLEPALAGSEQRIATSTGNIMLGIAESLNASLALATSGVFATEFSVEVQTLPGQEPNKLGEVVIGEPAARIEISSKRGEIRLLRRSAFSDA